jgi:rifampicin phosphotransferase
MNWFLSAAEIQSGDRLRVGGKAYALALLARAGFTIPETLCITSDAYLAFVDRTGLRERVLLELHRKDFKEMRWEEIWDCATRIRNMFLTKPIPEDLEGILRKTIEIKFSGKTVAIRSSAPEEDTAASSFAGLHESHINVRGTDSILEHIRMVWASLWSDAALLYRQEIGLDVEKSAMAIVVQETVAGDRSGVVFTQNPNDASQGVVEAVHGLNQGLVDGAVEPDRWLIHRSGHTVIAQAPSQRKYWMIPARSGVHLTELPQELSHHPPLNPQEALSVFKTAQKAEEFFKKPQDVEWTIKKDSLVLLQSRPITTLRSEKPADKRSWYLSLHRSFENLKEIRKKIEDELIPAMISEAKTLGELDLKKLSDTALAAEIKQRWEINHKWVNIYWAEFIPFAHGIRLFGQIYNDAMHPDDPYEFIDLLTDTDMASIERNKLLMDLAADIRADSQLAEHLQSSDPSGIPPDFMKRIEEFIEQFGDLSCAITGGKQCVLGTEPLFKLLLEMAKLPAAKPARHKSERLKGMRQRFLNAFSDDRKEQALEILDLARASYRLRDDDNIYLGRIEAQLLAAVQEGKRRIADDREGEGRDELRQTLKEVDFRSEAPVSDGVENRSMLTLKARQLIGQPAGPGLARGKARVIRRHSDLADFKRADVLVCDAVDPNMTFVIPLAAAVVERRGGMLIHGAIIAREYGLPCVTGIPDATALIKTGDEITVDGFLGIVTIGSAEI